MPPYTIVLAVNNNCVFCRTDITQEMHIKCLNNAKTRQHGYNESSQLCVDIYCIKVEAPHQPEVGQRFATFWRTLPRL